MNILDTALSAIGLALASLAQAREKLNASANTIHWFGAHRQGLDDARLSRWVGETAGVVTMAATVAGYTVNHGHHHRDSTFATLNDPDAKLMWNLNLRPGRSYAELKRSFFAALVSPRLHGPMTLDRLRATFGADQPRWRRVVAFGFWGGLAAAATAGGWLGGLLLGGVMPLMIGGNIATFIQIASEHKHLRTFPEGRERHAALSHGRNLLGWVPPEGAPWWRWLGMPFSLAAAVVARLVILPGPDLHAHDMHHIGAKPQLRLARWGWLNAAYEFSPLIWADPALAARRYPSVWAAIRAFLLALSKEAPLGDR